MKIFKEKQNESVGIKLLKASGIKEGQIILDFGCGKGTYTIPAAKLTGNSGRVYAVDENASKLNELLQKCQDQGLTNIKIIHTNGELHLEFENEQFDVVLLYDIFWYFPAGDQSLITLLKEIYRVSKNNALISVYPEHTNAKQLKNIMINHGFKLVHTYSGEVIHEDTIVHGSIYNFNKEGKNE